MRYITRKSLRRLTAIVSLCSLTMLLALNAFAQGKQDFTVVNETGVEIAELYVSPHNVNSWQEDVLGQDTLPSGEAVEIKFSRTEKAKLWDLKIVDSEGNSIEWANLNLLEISKVTLHYNAKTGKAWADVE